MPQTPTHAQLLAVADEPRALADLRTYFGTDRPAGTMPRYTGGFFELLAGGGDRAQVAHRVTADDLLAVQMLSVRVPGEVALDLLEGPLGEEVAAHLVGIDTGVSIGTPEGARLLADDGPAAEAWALLKKPDGMGWVTANKLLARKRPALIPVYDGVIRCAFRPPNRKLWNWLNLLFAEQDGALPALLTERREAARVPHQVSPLRVLDVIVWMRHRAEHRASRCPGLTW